MMKARLLDPILETIGDMALTAIRVAVLVSLASAQTGVLIRTTGNGQPDPSVLSLAKMNVDITIEDQHADVRVVQIFENHTEDTYEGQYLFALPAEASVSDFAVWDSEKRVPGVMMEKRRANKIYEEIKSQAMDPGLLQQDDEHGGASAFSAKIFPILPYGTKRLEMEYTESLPVDNLESTFTFPLKPAYGEVQKVGDLRINIRVDNSSRIIPKLSDAYPLTVTKRSSNGFSAEFKGRNVALSSDLTFSYRLDVDRTSMSVIAHRSPENISVYDLRDPSTAKRAPDGYFQAQAIFAPSEGKAKSEPKSVLLMFDTSISMYGDKLRRAVEAADYVIGSLRPEDSFNLLLFNDGTNLFSPRPVAATPKAKEAALKYLRDSALEGGTNLRKALAAAAAQCRSFPAGRTPRVVAITDANPTAETVKTLKIAQPFVKSGVRFFGFGVGSDSDTELLKELSRSTNGYYVQVRETEDTSFRLKSFLDRVFAPAVESMRLSPTDNGGIYDVYSTSDTAAEGSSYAYVGRYRKPGQVRFTLNAVQGGVPVSLSNVTDLPENEALHGFLPRVWAKARINALLREMNLNGEREDLISEIISLSEKYKIVTPYTAFIAAPRALLRPRLIQPGDPVIRVRTDSSVTEVFAVLPFGETLPLRYSKDSDVWQTRFLAPTWMQDGTYFCRLLLRDRSGNVYEEKKSFVIDSRSPKVRLVPLERDLVAGESVKLKVLADRDTHRLTARIYGGSAVPLTWSANDKANTGILTIPADLVSGSYFITVTAEDFAHNQTTEQYSVTVRGTGH